MPCHTGDHVQHNPSSNGLTFTTTGGNEEHIESSTSLNTQDSNHPNIVAGTDCQVHENIRCFGCNNYGHYQSHCPQASSGGQQQSGEQHLTMGLSLMQSAKQSQGKVPNNWVLLDNQSTIDVFCNGALLHIICQATTPLDIHCNSESTTSNMEGDLPGYSTVWYHPIGIANISSLGRMKQCYRITFDSEVRNKFLVTMPDRTVFEYKKSPTGL